MPYRCQVCRDCDSESDVYQSDRDYPSDVDTQPRRHTRRYGNTRRDSRRYSRNYYNSISSSRYHRYNRRYSRDRNNKEKEATNRKKEYDSDSSTQSDESYTSKSDDSKNSDSVSDSDEFVSLCDTSCSSDSEDDVPSIDKREIGKNEVENTKDENQKEVTVEHEVKVGETRLNEVGDVKIADENGDKAKTFGKEEKVIEHSILTQNNEKGVETVDAEKQKNNEDLNNQRSEESLVKIEEPTVKIEKASDNEITDDSDTNLTALEQSKTNQTASEQSKSADFEDDNDITRAKREAGRRGQKTKKPRSKSTQKNHRKVKRSFIKMATGIKGSITVPKPKSWKCGTAAKLITLRPKGKFSRFEYRLVANEMKRTIVHHSACENAGGCFKKYDIVKIQKVINGCLWKRYRHRQTEILNEVGFVNQRMLFHGDAHVDELIQTGFDERYSNVQGMFGAGLYFAKHSSKANQYAFGYMGGTGCPQHKDKSCMLCERRILLCRVTLGKTRNHFTANKLAHPPVGYDSVTGLPSDKPGGLKYPEFIVYRGEQVYPEYLITYKIAN